MKRIFALAPLVLAACHSSPTVKAENASIAEVAQQARGQIKVEPGQWTNNTEVLKFDMPGMKDPRMAQIIGESMKRAQAQAHSYCITPEEAANPSGRMFNGGKDKGDCRYEHFTMGDGKVDAKMVCSPKQGGGMTMTMSGTYSPTAYDMTADMQMSNPMAGGAMTMKVHTKGARTGECPAGAK